MTDREFVAQRKRLLALMKKWREVLSLDEWLITFQPHRGAYEVEGAMGAALASADVRWEYRQATLAFDCEMLASHTDSEVQDTFIHEAMHVLVNEMRDDTGSSISHEERVCTTLALVVQRAYEMGIQEGQKSAK